MLPKRFDKPETVFTAMQFAASLGLPQLIGLRQIAVINGTPSIFGDLPLSLCYSSGKLESNKDLFVNKEGKEICLANKNLFEEPYAAVSIVKRFRQAVSERFFTIDEAKKAGLYPAKPDSAWSKYTRLMLKYRSRTPNLKDNFGEVLNGIPIAEYDFNVHPDDDGDLTLPDAQFVTPVLSEIYSGTAEQNKILRELFVTHKVDQETQPKFIKEMFGKEMSEAEALIKKLN
jgi:hypothetical protein